MIWTPGRICILLCLLGQALQDVAGSRVDVAPLLLEGPARKLLQQANRPQTPKPPFPYTSENVTFTSFVGPDVTLAGTLTLPNTPPPHPAVLLISGAGPTDRDQTLYNHKWFLVLADHLTRNGIAVLRYDDQGVGESTGDPRSATTYDLADDAIGGVRYLKTRADIDPAAVGIFGHSEGGIIATIAVSKLKDTGRTQWMPLYLVLAAPPALPFENVMDNIIEVLAVDAGLNPQQVEDVLEGGRKISELLKGADRVEDVSDEVSAVLNDLIKAYGKILGLSTALSLASQFAFIKSEWYKVFLSLDPLPYFERVDIPVFILLGSKDTETPPKYHEEKIRAAFANNPDANITMVDGANHMFQPADTGLLLEIAKINDTISPPVLDMIGNWILERTGESS